MDRGSKILDMPAASAAGTSIRGEVGDWRITHAILHGTNVEAINKLNVGASLRGRDFDQLIQTMPVRVFAGISSLGRGMDIESLRQAALLSTDAAGNTDTIRYEWAIAIPLGLLDLSGNDTLDVTLTASQTLAAGSAASVSWIALNATGVDNPLGWRKFNDTNLTVPSAARIFLFKEDVSAGAAAEASALDKSKLSVTVKESETGIANEVHGDTCWAAGAALGNIGIQTPKDLIPLYGDASYGVAQDVRIDATGTDANSWNTIVAQRVRMVGRYERKVAAAEALERSILAKKRFSNTLSAGVV